MKHLGIYYDQKLTFKRHISFMASRLASISSLIYRVKHIVPQSVQKIMYNAHVSSLLNYCNIIWANTYDCHIHPLTLILKRIIRNITHSEFLAHTEPLFRELRILDIQKTRKLALAMYFYQNRDEIIQMLTAEHQYMTRHRNRLRPAIHNHTLYEKSFIYQAPKLWNEINHHFQLDNLNHLTPRQFKNKIKHILLDDE